MTSEQRQTLGLILLMAFLAAIGPLSTDTYIPSLSTIAHEFGVSNGQVQWSVSSFFLGIAIGQLFMGPFSDRFGRRPVLLFGFGVYVIATIVCAMAPNITTLITARAVQGLAAAATPAAGRAMVRDLWQGDQAARAMSYITMAIVIAPALAPTIGAVILEVANWRDIFWFLLIFAGICLPLVLWRLPETHGPEKRQNIQLMQFFRAYKVVLKDKRAWAYLLTGGLSYAAMFAYITGASIVYTDIYGVSSRMFGLLFALNIFGLFLGTWMNSIFVTVYGYHKMTAAGVIMAIMGSTMLFGVVYLNIWGIVGIIVALFITLTPTSMLGANCTTGLMDLYPDNAGGAVALFGVVQFGLGAFASMVAGAIFQGSALSMAVPVFVASIGSFLAMMWLVSQRREHELVTET